MNIIIGFSSLGALIIIQLIAFTFAYGKLTQRVADMSGQIHNLSDRIERLENR